MAFETGVVVFFRAFGTDNNLARSVHPNARSIQIHNKYSHPEDYVILDENDELLGLYPRDWVACILPLQTIGPADVANQQTGRDSSPSPTARNPQSISRRAKGIDTRE